jgi:hypothetical protein
LYQSIGIGGTPLNASGTISLHSSCPVYLAGFKILLSISVTCLATGHLGHEAHAT